MVKTMLTVFFDYKGIVHHEYAPPGQTVNKEYYREVLRRLREFTVWPGGALMMNNALLVEENGQHCLHIASTHSRFLGSRRGWGLPLRRLSLGFGVIAIDPRFVTCYDRFQEVFVVLGTIKRSCAAKTRCSFCSSESSFGTNLADTRLIPKSSVTID